MAHAKVERPTLGFRSARVTLGALAALFVSFLIFSTGRGGLFARQHLALVPSALLQKPWTLFTHALIHPSFGSLVSSALALLFFGAPAEQRLGARRTLALLGAATLFGALCESAVAVALGHPAVIVGAGPASLSMIAAFGVVYADLPIALFGLSQMRASTCALLFIGISLVLYLFSSDYLNLVGGLGGAAVGALATLRFELEVVRGWQARFRRWRIRRRYRVIPGGRDVRRYLH